MLIKYFCPQKDEEIEFMWVNISDKDAAEENLDNFYVQV